MPDVFATVGRKGLPGDKHADPVMMVKTKAIDFSHCPLSQVRALHVIAVANADYVRAKRLCHRNPFALLAATHLGPGLLLAEVQAAE